MYQSDELQKKWQPVLEHPDLLKLTMHIKRLTATLLEKEVLKEQNAGSGGYQAPSLLGEAATNAMGAHHQLQVMVQLTLSISVNLTRKTFYVNLIAYDICGVQREWPTDLSLR